MLTAKVFRTGRSQAVRLPKECRFEVEEVCVHRLGDMLLLYPRAKGWRLLRSGLEHFTADFLEDRRQPGSADAREGL